MSASRIARIPSRTGTGAARSTPAAVPGPRRCGLGGYADGPGRHDDDDYDEDGRPALAAQVMVGGGDIASVGGEAREMAIATVRRMRAGIAAACSVL